MQPPLPLEELAFNHENMATLQGCDFPRLGTKDYDFHLANSLFHLLALMKQAIMLRRDPLGATNSPQGAQSNSPQGTQSSQQPRELRSGYFPGQAFR